MKYLPLTLILFLILSGCYQDSAALFEYDPDLVIPEEKMVEVMTDIQLLEGFVAFEQSEGGSATSNLPLHYENVLKKHQLSEEEYLESMRYYNYNTEIYDRIMEKVIINLVKLESQVTEEE